MFRFIFCFFWVNGKANGSRRNRRITDCFLCEEGKGAPNGTATRRQFVYQKKKKIRFRRTHFARFRRRFSLLFLQFSASRRQNYLRCTRIGRIARSHSHVSPTSACCCYFFLSSLLFLLFWRLFGGFRNQLLILFLFIFLLRSHRSVPVCACMCDLLHSNQETNKRA